MAGDENIVIERTGAAGKIVLDRGKVMNAITQDMCLKISEALPGFSRDPGIYALLIRSELAGIFSAGGDVREMLHAARTDLQSARRIVATEYALNWQLECFSKPIISLIDGLVVGTGVGLTIYGTHRVAGENYLFAMPETGIGFFPDDGLAWTFARMPGQIGLYLGLTGRRIGRADAFRLGIVTHCIPAKRFPEVLDGLSRADPVDPLLDSLHEDPGPGALEPVRALIEEHFSATTLDEILTRLDRSSVRSGPAGAWCADVLGELRRCSPLSLKVTFLHIRDAVHRDLRQTLAVDYRLASRFLGSHDFSEGVRASFVNKDLRPRWSPGRLAAVSDAMVQRYFAFMPGDELILPTRQEMQASRI